MTERKSKEPIEAFGPELMQALVEGGKPGGKFIVKFEKGDGVGKKFAHTFMRRIHTLRQRMRDLNHPQYPVAMRAQLRLVWGKKAVEWGASESWLADDKGLKGAWVVITPRDSEFAPFLANSGLGDVSTQPQPALPPTPSRPDARVAKAEYDDLLDELEDLGPGADA